MLSNYLHYQSKYLSNYLIIYQSNYLYNLLLQHFGLISP